MREDVTLPDLACLLRRALPFLSTSSARPAHELHGEIVRAIGAEPDIREHIAEAIGPAPHVEPKDWKGVAGALLLALESGEELTRLRKRLGLKPKAKKA